MSAIATLSFEGIKVAELVVGSVLGIALGIASWSAPRFRPLLPVAGAVVGVLLLVPFHAADGWVVAATMGAAAPVVGSWLLAERRGSAHTSAPWIAKGAAMVGAVLLGPASAAMVEVPRPAVVVVFAGVAALASLASDRHLTPTAVVAMAAWTAFGLFLCNPDTEGSSLLGALLATAAVVAAMASVVGAAPPAVSTPAGSGRPPVHGRAVPLVLVLVWTGVNGASGREDTIIGGYACLGVLLVLPLAVGLSLLVPGHDRRPVVISGRLLTAVQAPLVVVCARIGGVRTTAERAVLVSGACLALATAVLALVLAHPRASDPSS